MKAALCKATGRLDALVVEDVPSPEPTARQVLIRVEACGVNFPDTLMVQGRYQFKPPLPFAPGGEIAGTILRLGASVDRFNVGDRVMASIGHGGFAAEAVAEADRVVAIPAGLDAVRAAAFLTAYGTSLHALQDRGRLRPGETVLVLGAAGGVGIAAVEIAKALGARVIAAASSAEKLRLCREHGADETIDYAGEDLRQRIRALTGDRGVDVIYDPVGGAYSEPALRSIAWNGRFLVVGFAAGEIPKIALNLPLLKSCDIVGVYWGPFIRRDPEAARRHIADLVRLLEAGKLNPAVTAVYPLARAGEALAALSERRAMGKLVVVP